MGGSGPDRTDDFQILCGSGLDQIQIYRIKTGLDLKISQSAHLWWVLRFGVFVSMPNFTLQKGDGCLSC